MFGKFVLRTIVGVIVYLFFGTIFTGSAAGQLLAVAVICTGGVGLIIVIPACYAIGALCTFWCIPFEEGRARQTTRYAPVKTQSNATALDASKSVATSHSQAALEDYIASELSRGMVWDTIHKRCLRAGWPEAPLKSAFEAAKQRSFHERF